jgi:hypothetical protein
MIQPGSKRTHSGKASWQSPQAVHFSISIYRGAQDKVAVKSPACPRQFDQSGQWHNIDMVLSGISADRLGEMVHKSQLLVGNVRSSWVISPPMAGRFVNQNHIPAGFGQIHGRFHTADATADYQNCVALIRHFCIPVSYLLKSAD